MDDVELEAVVNVPDTPDRPIYPRVIGGKHLGSMDEKSITDLAWRNLALAENSTSRRPVTSQKISHNKAKRGSSLTGDTPLTTVCAPNNAPLVRRVSAEKSCEGRHCNLAGEIGKGKMTRTNSPLKISGTGKEAILDLTENTRQAPGVKTAYPFQGSANIPHARSTRKTPSTQNNSALCDFDFSASPICAGIRMKKEIKNENEGPYLAMNHAKMVDLCDDSPVKKELQDSLSRQPSNVERITRQKRLVRNGCIAPQHNATKANELTKQIGDNASSSGVLGRCAISRDKDIVDISDIVSQEKSPDKLKGKGLLIHQPIANPDDNGTVHCRNSSEFAGERGGWRTTSRHLNNTSHSSVEVTGHPSRSKQNVGCSTSMPQRNRVDGKLSGSRQSSRARYNSLEDTAAHSSSGIISGTRGVTESHNVENVLSKRKRKEGTISRNNVECWSSVSCDSDSILLDKSGEPSNQRSSKMPQRLGNLDAEVVELSPKIREEMSLRSDTMHTEELNARARQLEADERLALELQEQFYHEEPAFEVGERSLSTQSNRQLRSSNNQNPPNRRRAQSQVLTHNRTTHSRSRNVGQSRSQRISGMRRRFRFPLNMDLDMRLDVLEALESASGDLDDMGMADNIFQIQRDFNENDYEMLLALDENNHRHAGSSNNQVNSLPQSQVQSEAMEEACAICLEAPTFGETIRHLPCLHKFHKDCIDPWLLRKTSCPICKSSIT